MSFISLRFASQYFLFFGITLLFNARPHTGSWVSCLKIWILDSLFSLIALAAYALGDKFQIKNRGVCNQYITIKTAQDVGLDSSQFTRESALLSQNTRTLKIPIFRQTAFFLS